MRKKICVSIFIVTIIYIILGMLGNKVFATTPGTLTSDISGIDDVCTQSRVVIMGLLYRNGLE